MQQMQATPPIPIPIDPLPLWNAKVARFRQCVAARKIQRVFKAYMLYKRMKMRVQRGVEYSAEKRRTE